MRLTTVCAAILMEKLLSYLDFGPLALWSIYNEKECVHTIDSSTKKEMINKTTSLLTVQRAHYPLKPRRTQVSPFTEISILFKKGSSKKKKKIL